MEKASEYLLPPTSRNLRKRKNKSVIITEFKISHKGKEFYTVYLGMEKRKYAVSPELKNDCERFGDKIIITQRNMIYMNLIRGSYDPTHYKKKIK